jgi:hypothetical protein
MRGGEELVSYFIVVAMTTAQLMRGPEPIRWPELIRGAVEAMQVDDTCDSSGSSSSSSSNSSDSSLY